MKLRLRDIDVPLIVDNGVVSFDWSAICDEFEDREVETIQDYIKLRLRNDKQFEFAKLVENTTLYERKMFDLVVDLVLKTSVTQLPKKFLLEKYDELQDIKCKSIQKASEVCDKAYAEALIENGYEFLPKNLIARKLGYEFLKEVEI